jgi:DNA-binding NarL/FixJ family response regulator
LTVSCGAREEGCRDVRARTRGGPGAGGLTPREVQVLRHVAAGETNKEIASRLCLAVSTVERHLVNLYTKIGARGRADAIAYALRHGLDDSAQ